MNTAKPASRFSTRATTSSPCSFQSTAERKEKYTQPSVSRVKRPASSHRSVVVSTTRREPSPPTATPNRSWTRARACACVSTLVGLLAGSRALARLAEVGDLLLELEESVQERVGRRRAPRHVHVHRDDAVHAFHHVIAVAEGAARVGAGAHGHRPLRIGHLLVDPLEHGRHLDGDGAGDDHEIGVARRGEGGHHLDGAAGEAEGDGPHRGLARPVEEGVGDGGDDEAAGKVVDPLFHALEEPGVLVTLRTLLVELLPLLEILELGPDGGGNLRSRRLYFHSKMPSRSA